MTEEVKKELMISNNSKIQEVDFTVDLTISMIYSETSVEEVATFKNLKLFYLMIVMCLISK
jgi:hypothetical protein